MKKAPTIEYFIENIQQGKKDSIIEFSHSLAKHLEEYGDSESFYYFLSRIQKILDTAVEFEEVLATVFIASLNQNLPKAIEYCTQQFPVTLCNEDGLCPLVFAAHKDDDSRLFFQLLESYINKQVAIEIERLANNTDGEHND